MSSFRIRFNACQKYYRWSEQESIFQLQAALTGRAAQVLEQISEDSDLHDIFELLNNTFEAGANSERARFLLKSRVQGPRESLEAYFLDLLNLSGQAFG